MKIGRVIPITLALAILAIVLSTVRGEPPKWISDAPPLLLAALTLGSLVATHPRRSVLWLPGTRAASA